MTWARALLRLIAVLIAGIAVIDPAVVLHVVVREPLTIVAMTEDDMSTAARVRDAIGGANTTVTLHSIGGGASACPSSGGCVIASRGVAPAHVSAGATLLAVVAHGDAQRGSGATITRIDAPAQVHRDGAAALRIETNRPAQRIDLFDGDTVVGSTVPSGQTRVDVQWIPLAAGARRLRAVADGSVADVGVLVVADRLDVLFYEPQATWLGTFVRRALDDDDRFNIRGRTRLAPPVAVSRGQSAALTGAALRDVRVVVVTAPSGLTSGEVDVLERYVSQRGGSLIVLADERPHGSALRLLPPLRAQGRDADARQIGMLQASEWLTFEPVAGVATVAAVDDHPVIVSRPLGSGRIVASGAMDAWRFRIAANGFDAFWTTLAWEMARATGPVLRVETDRVVARPGESIDITAEVRDIAPDDDHVTIAGSVDCDGREQFVRLWPAARAGRFQGTVRLERPGDCAVKVRFRDDTSTAAVTIRDDFTPLADQHHRLAAIAAAHGALFVTELGAGTGSAISERLSRRPTRQILRPMRSPYWLLPFVACLATEWFLRRRSGLS